MRRRFQHDVLEAARIEVNMHSKGELSDIKVAFVIKAAVINIEVDHRMSVITEP